MRIDESIKNAEKILPGVPLSDDKKKDIRWQRIIAIEEFIQTNPEEVWNFIKKWGAHEQEDIRMAIATCLLEHMLEHHYKLIFPKLENEIKENYLFFDTLSRCAKFGQANTKVNSKRFDDLIKKYSKV